MTTYNPPFYLYSLNDVAGVAAANNYFSVFNPVGSGYIHIAFELIVSTYAAGVTASQNSLVSRRITGHSGGTLVTDSAVERFVTAHPNPKTEIRFGNPTVTGSGGPLAVVPPVISTGTGTSNTSLAAPPGASFLLTPGQGLVFGTAAGDTDQVWNFTYLFSEARI